MTADMKFDQGKYVFTENELNRSANLVRAYYGDDSEEADMWFDLCYFFNFAHHLHYESVDALRVLMNKVEPSLQTRMQLVLGVLDFGEKKYARDSWRTVRKAKERYLQALLRHAIKPPTVWSDPEVPEMYAPEDIDEESGHLHKAHFLCNCYFLLELV